MIELLSQLSDIPAGSYQGYVWYSDQERPVTLLGDPLPDWPGADDKRFVVEAMLYDPAKKQSYQVVHTGRLIIQKIDLQKRPKDVEVEKCTYLPYRLDEKVTKICFWRLWKPQPDQYCDNLPVLKPVAWAFGGFEIDQR